MAVERKNSNVNFIGSFLVIITAGTIYRLSSLNRKVMQVQMTKIL